MRRFALLDRTAIPRSSIESFRHASIDAFLKDIKAVSRRVTALSTPYHIELQLLERIYYKGKNQHRSALFWRKVLEIRRLGTRISEVDLSGFLKDLHYAFYGTEENNPKLLRGAWKQAPDSGSYLSLLRQLRSVCFLVDQTRSRFRVAYEAFTQQVRTATFIPLAMSLISITSRLDFLTSELREILALLWKAVARILDTTVAEPDTDRYSNVSLPLDPFVVSAVMTSRAGTAKNKRKRVTAGFTEDIGSRVPRVSYAPTSGSHTPKGSSSTVGQKLLTELDLFVKHDNPSGITETLGPHPPISVVSLSAIPRMSSHVPEVAGVPSHSKIIPPSEPLPIQRSPGKLGGHDSREVSPGKKLKIRKVKKKKSLDEIDDIFGF